MQELKAADYEWVLPCIKQVEYPLFARVVIERKQCGQVFVDQKRDPGVVLLSHHSGHALLWGNEKDLEFDAHMLEPLLAKRKYEPIEQVLFIYPKGWGEGWELSLGNRFQRFTEIQFDENASYEEKVAKVNALTQDHVMGWRQASFKFQRNEFEHNQVWSGNIPLGFVLKRIEQEEIKRIKGEVIPSLLWNSDEDFLKNGVGFCVLHGEEIISICFSAFITGSMMEFGVETNENYRGQGFGVLAGAALIEYCLKNGIEPVWGCDKDANISSYRLAQKLGFRETSNYPCYSWINNPVGAGFGRSWLIHSFLRL